MRNAPDDPLIGEFTSRQGMVLVVSAGLAFVALLLLGRESMATPILISVGTLGSVAWIFRPAWKKPWFWTTMVCVAIGHAFLIANLPLSEGIRIAPIIAIDIVVVLGVISLAARLIEGRWP